MKNLNKFKGFTLVEVLIVIIIVGILIAALLPRLTGTQSRARDTARAAHANQIGQAGMLYLADNAGSVLSGCVDSSWIATGNLVSIPTDPQGTSGDGSSTSCTNDEYAVYSTTDGKWVVVADVENSGQGNCTVTE